LLLGHISNTTCSSATTHTTYRERRRRPNPSSRICRSTTRGEGSGEKGKIKSRARRAHGSTIHGALALNARHNPLARWRRALGEGAVCTGGRDVVRCLTLTAWTVALDERKPEKPKENRCRRGGRKKRRSGAIGRKRNAMILFR
jgi:hypothetical protein